MLLEKMPRPSSGMPSSSRTLLWAPSAPTTYCARMRLLRAGVDVPHRRGDAVGVLRQVRQPRSRAALRRRPDRRACAGCGSSPGWLMNSRRHGLNVVDADVEARDDVGQLAPGEAVHRDDGALRHEFLVPTAARTSSSMPARGTAPGAHVEMRRRAAAASRAQALDRERADAVLGEEHRGGEPDQSATDDQDRHLGVAGGLSAVLMLAIPVARACKPRHL